MTLCRPYSDCPLEKRPENRFRCLQAASFRSESERKCAKFLSIMKMSKNCGFVLTVWLAWVADGRIDRVSMHLYKWFEPIAIDLFVQD